MQDAILIALLSWKTKSINCDAIYNILASWMTLILVYRYTYLFKQQNMQMKAKHTTEWLDLAKDYSLADLFERLLLRTQHIGKVAQPRQLWSG